MTTKKILIPMAVIAVLGAGIYGVSRVSAASDPAGPQTSLVQKIADTFHLDKAKVQAVFDQNRADHEAGAEAHYEARLTQAVTDGQLTAAQKDAVLSEHNKLKTEMDALQGQSGSDRHAAMGKIRTEAEDWAKQNNLDAKWLLGPHPLRGMGPMERMHHDGAPGDTATPSSSPSA